MKKNETENICKINRERSAAKRFLVIDLGKRLQLLLKPWTHYVHAETKDSMTGALSRIF